MSIKRCFVFHCLVVNRYYLNCFIDQLLPSFINSDNDWFFHKYKSKFLISTSQNDMKVFINSRIFQLYKNVIEFDFQIIPEKILKSKDAYHIATMMSEAHFYATEYCMKLNCYGSFLSPDMVVNSRFLQVINESIEQNIKVCIAPAFRGTYLDSFLKEKTSYTSQAPKIALLPARLLVKIMFENMHAETKTFFFNSPDFLKNQNFTQPTCALYKNQDESQILGFGMSWFLCVIDFSQIPQRNKTKALKSLKMHTIDAFFLDRLLGSNIANVRVINNSDDIFVLSWDKAPVVGKVSNELEKIEQTNSFKLEMIKIGRSSGIYDDTKLKLYLIPWVWNSGDKKTCIDFHDYFISSEFVSQILDVKKTNNSKKDFITLLYYSLKILGSSVKQKRYDLSFVKRYKLSRQINSSQDTHFWVFDKLKSNLIKFFKRIKLIFFILSAVLKPFKTKIHPFNQARGGFIHAILRIYISRNSIRLAKIILHKSLRNEP